MKRDKMQNLFYIILSFVCMAFVLPPHSFLACVSRAPRRIRSQDLWTSSQGSNSALLTTCSRKPRLLCLVEWRSTREILSGRARRTRTTGKLKARFCLHLLFHIFPFFPFLLGVKFCFTSLAPSGWNLICKQSKCPSTRQKKLCHLLEHFHFEEKRVRCQRKMMRVLLKQNRTLKRKVDRNAVFLMVHFVCIYNLCNVHMYIYIYMYTYIQKDPQRTLRCSYIIVYLCELISLSSGAH